ncbi:MAG: PIN domain-containing protein [bacterium]|nr:PIN domain-containing protein [bacterium]
MKNAFVDTDVVIRLLTGDDLRKQAEATALFEAVEAGNLTLLAPDTVIADAVYVLASPRLYRRSRAEIIAMLLPLLRLPNFKVINRRSLVKALDLYAETKIDFGDAMIVVSMEQRHSKILYSYDKDFDRIYKITRLSPGVL